MDFRGTRGKWKHKKGKRAKFEYDNFIIDEYGNHIVKWSNTGNGSHKLTIKESHANGLLISKAPEYHDEIVETITDLKILKNNIIDANKTNHLFDGMPELIQKWIDRKEQLIKEATEL